MTARKTKAVARNRPADTARSPLLVAHAAWALAKGRVAAADAAPRATDAQMQAALAAKLAAEWEMIATPAANLAEIRLRGVIVADMFAQAATDGTPTDGRHLAMLGVLLREIAEYVPGQEAATVQL